MEINIGDSVRTKSVMFFVDAHNPITGEWIEVQFPRWHRLTVVAVCHDKDEETVQVQLPNGFVATLDWGDIEQ